MNKKIEAEGNELVLSSGGSTAIIPKNRREEVLGYLDKDNHSAISDLVSKLPTLKNYAEDGTTIPDDPPSVNKYHTVDVPKLDTLPPVGGVDYGDLPGEEAANSARILEQELYISNNNYINTTTGDTINYKQNAKLVREAEATNKRLAYYGKQKEILAAAVKTRKDIIAAEEAKRVAKQEEIDKTKEYITDPLAVDSPVSPPVKEETIKDTPKVADIKDIENVADIKDIENVEGKIKYIQSIKNKAKDRAKDIKEEDARLEEDRQYNIEDVAELTEVEEVEVKEAKAEAEDVKVKEEQPKLDNVEINKESAHDKKLKILEQIKAKQLVTNKEINDNHAANLKELEVELAGTQDELMKKSLERAKSSAVIYGNKLRQNELSTLEQQILSITPKQRQVIIDNQSLINKGTATRLEDKSDENYTNWSEQIIKNEEINKLDDLNKIVTTKSSSKKEGTYVIVDKKNNTLFIYSNGNSKPIYTGNINVGEATGDGQTTTKLTKEGKAIFKRTGKVPNDAKYFDWDAGNRQTGAGKFYMSSRYAKGYHGDDILNLMNDSQYGNYIADGTLSSISTSFHSGYLKGNDRSSNGCVRCDKETLTNLMSYTKSGDEVYILPEDKDNSFVYENNTLNFKVKNPTKYDKYTDKVGATQTGQGINKTINVANNIPIKIDVNFDKIAEDVYSDKNHFNTHPEQKEVVIRYVNALSDAKEAIIERTGISGDVYNNLTKLAFGMLGAESKYGNTNNPFMNLVKMGVKAVDSNKGGSDYISEIDTYDPLLKFFGRDNPSLGLTQLRANAIGQDEWMLLNDLGIYDVAELVNPEKAAIATVALQAFRYRRQLGSEARKKYLDELPKRWNTGAGYTEKVQSNGEYINIKQKNN